jgi:large subunit ribosomal protein L25
MAVKNNTRAQKFDYQLASEKRKITGRQVKQLRKDGILPANIFGKKVKSLAIQLSAKEFLPVFGKAGETGVVELTVKSETSTRPVLIHNVQKDPVSDQPLHIDFYQVDLKEKITADIPVEVIGEAPAVSQKIGILIQPLTEVEVEALPTDLPEKLTLSVAKLEKIDDSATVKDLKPPVGVKILTSENQVVAKIEALAKEEVVAPPAAEAAPTEGEAKPTEGEVKPTEGETKKPEVKPDDKKPEVKSAPEKTKEEKK